MAETRIAEHPILGAAPPLRTVAFTLDGRAMTGLAGEPIAASLKAAGIQVHRYTKKAHSPRGVFCAIGRCTDCVMVVDGVPNVRTCVTPLAEGMRVETQLGSGGQHDKI
ncbi:MAG: (2Fe-2S)-binding protein [Oscillospiraceae bacterium]|jgi:predicted molibdopterin-dependent oxidoreductase YjgC|nr:(2Fe-2S)-binding protein [Oscillospiraceae bacterium]